MPWLGVAVTNVRPAGSRSFTLTPVAVLRPDALPTVRVNWTRAFNAGVAVVHALRQRQVDGGRLETGLRIVVFVRSRCITRERVDVRLIGRLHLGEVRDGIDRATVAVMVSVALDGLASVPIVHSPLGAS